MDNNKRIIEAAKADTGYALVLVNKESAVQTAVAKYFPRLKTVQPNLRTYDQAAYQAGLAKGATIKLNHQLT